MDSLLQWVALFGMVALALLFVLEIRRWRAIGDVIGGRQRVLRVILIVLIEALLVMILIGPMVTSKDHPVGALIYWMVCTFVGLAVVVLAVIDLWAVSKGYMMLNRDMFGGLREDERREK